MGFDGGGPDDAEIGAWRQPLSSISVEVLPLGFDRSVVNRFRHVKRRSGRNPKTSREVERQRANGSNDQNTAPPSPANPTMYQQSHVAISARPRFVGLYNIAPHDADITSVTCISSDWIPNPRRWLHAQGSRAVSSCILERRAQFPASDV